MHIVDHGFLLLTLLRVLQDMNLLQFKVFVQRMQQNWVCFYLVNYGSFTHNILLQNRSTYPQFNTQHIQKQKFVGGQPRASETVCTIL